MRLLGPPGVGKTHFSCLVAELLGAPHASVHFDQPTAGAQLRGSHKYRSNSEPGLLFNLLCLGDCVNPVVLLDELDKSAEGGSRKNVDPVAQLHGALEPETARCPTDISVEVEFDASLVTYIATANTVRGVGLPLLSRMEVFKIEPRSRDESFDIARTIVRQVLKRFGLANKLSFKRRSLLTGAPQPGADDSSGRAVERSSKGLRQRVQKGGPGFARTSYGCHWCGQTNAPRLQ